MKWSAWKDSKKWWQLIVAASASAAASVVDVATLLMLWAWQRHKKNEWGRGGWGELIGEGTVELGVDVFTGCRQLEHLHFAAHANLHLSKATQLPLCPQPSGQGPSPEIEASPCWNCSLGSCDCRVAYIECSLCPMSLRHFDRHRATRGAACHRFNAPPCYNQWQVCRASGASIAEVRPTNCSCQ